MREKRLATVWFSAILALLAGMAVSRAGTENGSITQVSGSTDVVAGMVTQGLRGATSNPPVNIGTGTVTAGDHLATDSTNVHVGGTTVASDVLPGTETIHSQNAYPQAATNLTGANLAIAAGQGCNFYTILTAANLSGKTFTVNVATTVGTTTTVLTDGSSFTHSSTNSTEATNLAGALHVISGISATAVSAVVYVTLDTGTIAVSLATNAVVTDASVNSGTSGNAYVSANSLLSPDGTNFFLGGQAVTTGGGNLFLGAQNLGAGTSANGPIGMAFCPGLSQKIFTIVTFGSVVGNTFTISYAFTTAAGSGATFLSYTQTLTAVASGATGLQFNAVTSNAQTATNLAAALNANLSASLFVSTAIGAVVYVVPQPGVISINLTTNASGANATANNGVDGGFFFGGGSNGGSGVNFGTNSLSNITNVSTTGTFKGMTYTQPLVAGAMTITTSTSSNIPNALNINTASTTGGSNSTGGDITITPGTGNASGTGRAGNINLTGATNTNNSAGTTINITAGTSPTGGNDVVCTGGAGGSTSGDAGTFQGLGGNGTSGGIAGGQARLKGGNGASGQTNAHAGGIAMSIGTPTGTGTANSDKMVVQAGFTEASGTTTQTLGDRVAFMGHNVTMSTTTATATTIVVLNVPTSGTAGSVIVQYMVQATGSAIVPGCTCGQFTVSCSNNSGTVTATAGSLTGVGGNVGAFTALSAGTISTSIASQAVSIKIAPSWSAGTATGVICTINCFSFGKGVTLTPQ